ncbi:MAG: NADH-quinone oxidoreductase subunit M [Betaproteobacteria bacterium]|nr:NADH-quinone oxidoreductase subunit M [Betaproteobacteria bacterium]
MSVPLLSLTIAAPLAGAFLLAAVPPRLARAVQAGALLVTLMLACAAAAAYDPGGARFQLLERVLWVPGLNVHYLVAVDGLSVLFLPSTALLFLAALAVADENDPAPRLHGALLLVLAAATLGIFCALDTMLFFLFWEATLVPLYFLLARRGVTTASPAAATRYALLMLAGGVPLLLAFVLLAATQPVPVFDVTALLAAQLPKSTQVAVFLLLLAGVAAKLPLVPLHTWLPQVALAGPGSLVALVAGLKVGGYALIRFAVPLAPEAAASLHWLLAGLGTLTLLYGAVAMVAQSNLRVVLAGASICHVGLVVLGIASLSAAGVQGAVALLLSFVPATGGAFLLLEILRRRTGSTDVHSLGGGARSMPLLAAGFFVCGLAGVGMPGTSSFPGEFMLILSALRAHTGAGMAALFGLCIAAVAFLHHYRRAFLGPVVHPQVAAARDLEGREWAVLVALVAAIFVIGLYPGPWLEIVRPAAEAWAAGVQR